MREPAERDRQAARRLKPQWRKAEPEERTGHLRRPLQVVEELRREVLEGVARGQGGRADPPLVPGDRDLAEAAAGVVADQGHVGEAERVERRR